MAFKIVWTEHAREDLRSLVHYIALDNPTSAEQFGFLIISKVDLLTDFPFMGRVVPEIGRQTVREMIVRPYRIIYEVAETGESIAIVRVWHAARGEPELSS